MHEAGLFPHDPVMDAVEALTRLGGIAATAEVVEMTSRGKLRTALRRGQVVRVGHGRLALPIRDAGPRARPVHSTDISA